MQRKIKYEKDVFENDPILTRNILKILTFLFLLSANFLLTGCWDRKEVNDMALVLEWPKMKWNQKKEKAAFRT
ncbi:hypothetical protein BIV60_14065 [Bacillus sp. MUM 116]|nr:hypothetical protein BIV60_14065 [Bacillus sp. MUM 116]